MSFVTVHGQIFEPTNRLLFLLFFEAKGLVNSPLKRLTVNKIFLNTEDSPNLTSVKQACYSSHQSWAMYIMRRNTSPFRTEIFLTLMARISSQILRKLLTAVIVDLLVVQGALASYQPSNCCPVGEWYGLSLWYFSLPQMEKNPLTQMLPCLICCSCYCGNCTYGLGFCFWLKQIKLQRE